jgi:ABC-type phosphate transport system substrate-binding protein
MKSTIKSQSGGRRNGWSIGLVVALFLQSTAALAEVVIVGNPVNKNHLAEDQVAKIFLGKAHELPDRTPVKPVDQAEGSGPREEFLKNFLHKDERGLKSYWSLLVFTGNGIPPEILADDQAVKKFVASNPNAIGYIDRKSMDDTVKVLSSD